MTAYYNEHDPFAAQWLRNLIDAGHIAPGTVDERDIRDVRPSDLDGFVQCHFFAGIGVWSYALRSAGWPDERPIWTGSCPCQPFSAAGRRAGAADERHLWPHWHHLIAERRPPIVLGEQVASKDGLGWLDLVQADMEGSGYALGASDLCAAGFGGAHIRQRLYFVGLANASDTNGRRRERGTEAGTWPNTERRRGPTGGGAVRGLAHHHHPRLEGETGCRSDGSRRERPPLERGSGTRRVADTDGGNACAERQQRGWEQRQQQEDGSAFAEPRTHAPMLGRHAADWLYCRDGKWRPVEPGTFPLVNAAPSRVGRLRAYGNGLDAETATEFVSAVIEAIGDCQLLLDESMTLI